ncbi:cadherin-like domain-containing protein [Methylobacterium sp. WL8]|uniref:cadherin-like domain-containing protein n=1 Tax=Methylobacterium sp. WL8 TaxID=2603899 RepID=UPI0011CC04FD|nr:cadherin-like domain-containing protein [Methylobacterium sp. WL8]TXN81506.1 hypothetical protein FV234_13295 [Methylobacterium sp. WL8]
MMIETKGTKTGTSRPDETTKYDAQGTNAKSGTPYYLALAVASLAAYLKSLFNTPVHAEAEAADVEPQPKPGPKLVALTPSDQEPAAREPDGRLAGTSGVAPGSEAPASEYDSPAFLRTKTLQFAKPDPQPNLNDFKASPVIPTPENDNRGAASGGGGGGGGRDERPSDAGQGENGPHSGNGVDEPVSSTEKGGSPTSEHSNGPGRDADREDAANPAGGVGQPADGPRNTGGGSTVPPNDNLPLEDEKGGTDGRRNRAPISSGPVLLANTTGCALLAIAMTDLLRNVRDPDGDVLSVRNVSVSSGALSPDGDGWIFDGDAVGPVTITYEVTDGEFSIAQTASFNVVERNQVTGSSGDDIILGTLCADAIDGGAGNDIIDARAGSDLIDGGLGDDHIVGGAGDDTILGAAGDDVIFAGSGADVVSGGTGNDRIFGEEGDDILFGDAGDDLLDGGYGNDILIGSTGSDMLFGGAGDDRLDGGEGNDLAFGGLGRDAVSGGAGDDRLEGGEGDDVLLDGSGRDIVLGQEGDDVIVAALDGDDDLFDGGLGRDTLDLTATTSGVTVDLAAGTAVGAEIGRDQLVSVEVVRGGSGADVIGGDAGPNDLFGGVGRDHLAGGAGNDLLDGGADYDVLSDGTGSDTVLGGGGDDVLIVATDADADRFDGGSGEDTLDLTATTSGVVVDLMAGTAVGRDIGTDAVASVEVVLGGSGDDVLSGSSGGDTLLGGMGQDRISGGAGDDRLDGGSGADTLLDGTGSDVVLGGAGDDVITASSDGEADSFDGGEGQDTLDLSAAHSGVTVDLILGTSVGVETGQDHVAGVEAVVGGSGADVLLGSTGGDSLSGGDGDDRLVGRSGDDVLDGGGGRDTILDGAGQDTVRSGAGDDRIVLAMDGDDDRIDGGEGSDTLDLGGATGNLLVDLVNHVVSGTELGEDQVESIERIVAGSGDDRFVIGDDDVVLTGGGGNDAYEFLSRLGAREPTRAVEITDFSVGDHVDLLNWSLFEAGGGTGGNSLADAMERNDGTVSGIRYRSALLGEGDVTVISADLDRDDTFETTIVLDGHHTLLFIEGPVHQAASTPTTPVT